MTPPALTTVRQNGISIAFVPAGGYMAKGNKKGGTSGSKQTGKAKRKDK